MFLSIAEALGLYMCLLLCLDRSMLNINQERLAATTVAYGKVCTHNQHCPQSANSQTALII